MTREEHQEFANQCASVVKRLRIRLKELQSKIDESDKIEKAYLTHQIEDLTRLYQKHQAAAWGYTKEVK